MNPFILEDVALSWIGKYTSNPFSRLVWMKGADAEVAPLGPSRCPSLLRFDTARRLSTAEVTIPIRLAGGIAVSADHLRIEATITLFAQIRGGDGESPQSNASLIAVATRYAGIEKLMEREVERATRAFCKSRACQELCKAEAELALAEEIKCEMGKLTTLPVQINRVGVTLTDPRVEAAWEKIGANRAAMEQRKEEVLNEQTLASLIAEGEQQKYQKALERELAQTVFDCKIQLERAKTQQQLEDQRLAIIDRLTEIAQKGDAAKFVINPAVYEAIEKAKLASDPQRFKDSMNYVLEILRSVADPNLRMANQPIVNQNFQTPK